MDTIVINGFNVSENNCNGILTRLYERRDNIGTKIDKAMLIGDDQLQDKLELEHDHICDTISKICDYRRTHNCLTEGDPGFSFY